MDNTGATLEDFSHYIGYHCRLLHDVEAAAFAELWFSPDIKDAIYIALSRQMGAAAIINGTLHKGKGIGSGLVEHMIIQPNGLPCYCGKRGCADSYCSVEALCGNEFELDNFFAEMERNSPEHIERWNAYVDVLTSVIDNVHMVIDCEIILGGHLAPYLTEQDAEWLNRLVLEKCAFPETHPYIRLGKCSSSSVAIGGGLLFIRDFLDAV